MLRVQSQEQCEDKFASFYRVCLQIIHHKHCVPVRKPSIRRKGFAGIHRYTRNFGSNLSKNSVPDRISEKTLGNVHKFIIYSYC